MTNTKVVKVKAVEATASRVDASRASGKPQASRPSIACSSRSAAVRTRRFPGLETTKVKVDAKGFIETDRQRRTAEPTILRDRRRRRRADARAQGVARGARRRSRRSLGHKAIFEPPAIPAVVFTDPEIAWCGLTEAEAKKQGIEVEVAKFPWGASGRAITLDRAGRPDQADSRSEDRDGCSASALPAPARAN